MSHRALLAIAIVCAFAGCDRAHPAAVPAAPPHDAARREGAPGTTSPASIPSAEAPAPGVAASTAAPSASPGLYRLPGPLSAATTEAALRHRFGDANVRVGDVPGGEGETSRGIVLFPDDPARRAYVYFRDGEHLRDLRLVRVVDAGSRWRLEDGIGIGTRLSTLVAINGKPLRFSGFDWDYGGTISHWNGGRLQPADGDAPRPMVRLTHGQSPRGAYPMGDAEFSSDDPRYPRLGDLARVGEIGVSFPGKDAAPGYNSKR